MTTGLERPARGRPRLVLRELEPGELDHERIWSAVFGVSLVVALVMPRAAIDLIRCPFKLLTHLPCPACGTTRGALAFLELRPLDGLLFNPLMISVLCAWGAFALFGAVTVLFRLPRVRPAGDWTGLRRPLGIGLVTSIALNWMYLLWAGI